MLQNKSGVLLVVWLLTAPAGAAEFQSLPALPESYLGHALVASSGFLYNIGGLGGINGAATAQKVFYAPLQGEGGLGAWREGPPLPEGVFFHAATAVEGTLVVLGGYHYKDSLTVSNLVYSSRPGQDGRPGPWQAATPLPEPVFFLSAGVWKGRIYVTGGWNGQALTSSVYSCPVNSDGTLGSWRAERPLPQGVYTHAAVSQGTLYVLGGVVNGGSQIFNGVYSAQIMEDGSLQPWAAATPLPQPLSNHAATVSEGRIVLTGGWNGSIPSDASLQAPLLADGSLGQWTALPALPKPLYLHGQASSGGFLFLSGGSDGQTPQSGVYSLALPPGPVEPPTDTLAARTTLSFEGARFGEAPPFISPQTLVLLTAQDDGSGPAAIRYAVDDSSLTDYAGPFRLSEGLHWLSYFSVDQAGNVEAVQASSVAVDGTAPGVSLEAGDPQAVLTAGELVLSSRTLLAVQAQDPVVGGAASGVADVLVGIDGQQAVSRLDSFFLPAVEGSHSVSFWAKDHLGNASEPRTLTYFLDQTPPLTTAEPAGGGPILGASALVVLSASDALAGVHHSEYSVDGGSWTQGGAFGLEEGLHEARFRSVDHVGNREEERSAFYRVDATAPQSALTIGAGESLFGVDLLSPETELAMEASDPVSSGLASGVARILYSLDNGPERIYAGPFHLDAGARTLRYWSVDQAGNVEEPKTASLSVASFLADALAGIDSVTLSGGVKVSGTVRSNGPFSAGGKSSVTGDVAALTVTLTGKSAISGTITRGTSTVPESGYDLAAARAWAQAHNNNAAIPAQFLNEGALTLTSRQTLSLPGGDYYLKGLKLQGRAALSLDGRVNIFLDGPLTLRAGSRLNEAGQASDLWIVDAYAGRDAHENADGNDDDDDDEERDSSHSGGHAVCLSGKVRAALNLYAPLSAVAVSGRGELAGRLLGRTVTLSGRAAQPSTIALAPRRHAPDAPKRLKGVVAGKGKTTTTLVASSRIERKDPSAGVWSAVSLTAQVPARMVAAPLAASGVIRRPHVMPPFSLAARAALAMVKTDKDSEIRCADHSAVVIPEGAAPSVLAVTVGPAVPAETRRAAMERDGLEAAGAGVEFGPEGTHFVKPVTLELPFDRSVSGDLAVHYWNPAKEQWERLASSVDRQAGVVRAQTDHFSLYQVMSAPLTPTAGGSLAFGEVYAFPNPARAGQNPTIHVEAGSADRLELRIYDIAGVLVHSAALDGSGTFEHAWDVSGVGSGVYIYTVRATQQGVGSISKRGRLAVIK